MSGSGVPILAATVISRLSLEKAADFFLSCAPLRCMMFLNLEWPAIVLSYETGRAALGQRAAKAQCPPISVIPAKAGIQGNGAMSCPAPDSRLRGMTKGAGVTAK